MQSETDLSTVTTKELMDEIGRRFETLVMAGSRRKKTRNNQGQIVMVCHGNSLAAGGMIEVMRTRLLAAHCGGPPFTNEFPTES